MNDTITEETPKQITGKKTQLVRILIFVLVIGITVGILLLRNEIAIFVDEIPGMGFYAFPAIFLASIIANATIIVPIPGVALTTLMGAFFHPFGVAVAAGLGASVGEISGYMAGFSGQGLIERTKWSDRLEKWMRKYGNVVVLVLAFIPNPLFDMAGMTAGALKLSLPRFLLWCALGKILKMLAFAYLGGFVINLFPG